MVTREPGGDQRTSMRANYAYDWLRVKMQMKMKMQMWVKARRGVQPKERPEESGRMGVITVLPPHPLSNSVVFLRFVYPILVVV